MTKYTKRQYQADVAANEAAIIANNELLESFERDHEAGIPLTNERYDEWQIAMDKSFKLACDTVDIERKWIFRNLSFQDDVQRGLIAQNID